MDNRFASPGMNAANKVKIAIKMNDKQPILTEFDTRNSLTSLVNYLCQVWHLELPSERYALKFHEPNECRYVTEPRKSLIHNGTILSLSSCPQAMAVELCLCLRTGIDLALTMRSLAELCADEQFVCEFVTLPDSVVLVSRKIVECCRQQDFSAVLSDALLALVGLLKYSPDVVFTESNFTSMFIFDLIGALNVCSQVLQNSCEHCSLPKDSSSSSNSSSQCLQPSLSWITSQQGCQTLKSVCQLFEIFINRALLTCKCECIASISSKFAQTADSLSLLSDVTVLNHSDSLIAATQNLACSDHSKHDLDANEMATRTLTNLPLSSLFHMFCLNDTVMHVTTLSLINAYWTYATVTAPPLFSAASKSHASCNKRAQLFDILCANSHALFAHVLSPHTGLALNDNSAIAAQLCFAQHLSFRALAERAFVYVSRCAVASEQDQCVSGTCCLCARQRPLYSCAMCQSRFTVDWSSLKQNIYDKLEELRQHAFGTQLNITQCQSSNSTSSMRIHKPGQASTLAGKYQHTNGDSSTSSLTTVSHSRQTSKDIQKGENDFRTDLLYQFNVMSDTQTRDYRRLGFSSDIYPHWDFIFTSGSEVNGPFMYNSLALDCILYFARNYSEQFSRLMLENRSYTVSTITQWPLVRGCVRLVWLLCDLLDVFALSLSHATDCANISAVSDVNVDAHKVANCRRGGHNLTLLSDDVIHVGLEHLKMTNLVSDKSRHNTLNFGSKTRHESANVTSVCCEGAPSHFDMIRRSQFCPMLITHSSAFEELFCTCVLLFNKTWREMRAGIEDFDKVISVVREQIARAMSCAAANKPFVATSSPAASTLLSRRRSSAVVGSLSSTDIPDSASSSKSNVYMPPLSFDMFRLRLNSLSYAKINSIWQERQKHREKVESQAKPILELRENLKPEIIELIQTQRINFITSGTKFVKYSSRGQRVKDKCVFVCLSNNRKHISYGDCSEDSNPIIDQLPSKITVSSLRRVLVGRECPHMRDLSNY